MAWMEMDYSKHMQFRWKIKWRLEYLGALGIMDRSAPLKGPSLPKALATILFSIESANLLSDICNLCSI